MSRFSQIARGAKQIHEVEIALAGLDAPVKLGVRVLLSEDDDAILAAARAFAIKQGVADPKDGNPIYDTAHARETIALACIDLDSANKDAPFFENAEEVRKGLDRDRIAYLFAKQQAWQDKCAPLQKELTHEAFIAKILEIAGVDEKDESPFDSMAPGLLVSFTRTLARQHVSLVMHKSPSGSDSTLSPGGDSKRPE